MKKIVRKIATLVCIVTLFAMPAATAYAVSIPTYVGSGNYVFNTGETLAPNESFFCMDYANSTNPSTTLGLWNVPAGNYFSFYLNRGYGTINVEIYRINVGLVYQQVYTGPISIQLPPISSNAEYSVLITNVSSEISYLGGYGGLVH